jgi:hypothetical protein
VVFTGRDPAQAAALVNEWVNQSVKIRACKAA